MDSVEGCEGPESARVIGGLINRIMWVMAWVAVLLSAWGLMGRYPTIRMVQFDPWLLEEWPVALAIPGFAVVLIAVAASRGWRLLASHGDEANRVGLAAAECPIAWSTRYVLYAFVACLGLRVVVIFVRGWLSVTVFRAWSPQHPVWRCVWGSVQDLVRGCDGLAMVACVGVGVALLVQTTRSLRADRDSNLAAIYAGVVVLLLSSLHQWAN
ncbi:MAG: hypothetical protein HY815_25025 [Candidatus Riflebacteria bacterium]|nr:hypothetical protein [Candidatus Riflebacteria bacterium]